MADEVEQGKGTAIFYFSGHGFRIGGENFLATYDTTLDKLAEDGLAVSEVQKLLAATGAKQRVLFHRRVPQRSHSKEHYGRSALRTV